MTTYSYDSRHRLSRIIFPDGSDERFTYYRDSTVLDRFIRDIWASHTYDRLKRLKQYYRYGEGAIDYAYAGQKLTGISERSYTNFDNYSFTYDSSYRLASEAQSTRGTVSYTYFPDDAVQTVSVSGGPVATQGRYPDGSLDTISWSLIPGQFKYRYTLPGQYESVTFPSGQTRSFTYDDQGRLLGLTNTDPVAGNLAAYAYAYDLNHTSAQWDRLGQRVTMTATETDSPSVGVVSQPGQTPRFLI